MKLHGNAALSLNGRRLVRLVIEEGRSIAVAAEAAVVSERTCAKWVSRYRAHGEVGLLDRAHFAVVSGLPLTWPPVRERCR